MRDITVTKSFSTDNRDFTLGRPFNRLIIRLKITCACDGLPLLSVNTVLDFNGHLSGV